MISAGPESFNQGKIVSPTRLLQATLVAMLTIPAAQAGEIGGLAPNTPPIVDHPFEFSFTNDFLAGPDARDDYRTQQFTINSRVGDRWVLAFENSILTLLEADEPARIDELSATAGYKLVNRMSDTRDEQVLIGFGLRSYGEFAGEQMQNGAHRLVRSSVDVAPYTGLASTDGTLWIDVEHYSLLRGIKNTGGWRWGYWLRGSALWTSDGQLDAAAGAYGVAGKGSVDAWFGLRQDWRSGYEAPVLAEIALVEEDLAAVFGVRWGPLVFETVQQLQNDASYGQLRIIAGGFGLERTGAAESRVVFDAGITIPDIVFNIVARWRAGRPGAADRAWRRSFYLAGGFGEPQHEDDPTIYRRTKLLGAGLDWERRLGMARGLTSAFVSAGVGWREERIFGDDVRSGEQSGIVSRTVALAGAGLRFDAGELPWRYHLRVQLGLQAVVPFGNATVTMSGETFDVQRPELGVGLGITLGRFTG